MKNCGILYRLLVTLILANIVDSLKVPLGDCQSTIQKYLAEASPYFNTTDKSLLLEIEKSLFAPECGTAKVLVELWRVISRPNIDRPNNFGTTEYFFRDQHCENPNPDLLAKHGQSKTASLSEPVVVFQHVVEREYMVRLCPCILNHCNCETIQPGSQTCSRIIRVNNTGPDQVFPWCRGVQQSPHPKIDSPIIQNCPAQLKITGVIPSCTAVRHYDQVEVILQAVQGHPTNCRDRPLSEMIKSDGLENIVRLHALNETHGSFDVDIKNVTHDVYYCVRVELVNHPYCNSGSDASLDRQTKICRPALWLEPIYISGETCRPSPCPDTQPNLPLITGASLAAALILAVSLVLLHRLACRRPQTHLDKTAADRLLRQFPAPQYPDVFFLYFTDSKEFLAVNRLVVRWLNDLGHRVIDLSDEVIQEELISSPESWITDKLEDPNTKVVVVNSNLANHSLAYTQTEPLGVETDNVSPLRVFSLRHIQQRLATNYRRLAIVQYRLAEAACLPCLVPHTRHLLPDHLAELQAWLAETHGWDDNENLQSTREQTLRDLKVAVQKYTSNHHL